MKRNQAMSPTEKPLVLIVDDHPTNIRVLAETLKSEYRVKTATNGRTALDLANLSEKPDLIMLDVMMPEMDGYEVCQHLKNTEASKDIPVIFVTAKREMGDEERGLNMGAADYITKPFSPPIVQARVRNHIALKQKTDLLESLASLDGLTGIPNRRNFSEAIDSEWRRAGRSGKPLSLIMADVDYFKAYNDHYGHGAGDDCLKYVATALANIPVRPGDLVARYGGEEFVAILPDTDFDGAKSVAEDFRSMVEALALPHAHSSVAGHVTISAGFATALLPRSKRWEALLEEADKMLYQAKRAGRNRVCGI